MLWGRQGSSATRGVRVWLSVGIVAFYPTLGSCSGESSSQVQAQAGASAPAENAAPQSATSPAPSAASTAPTLEDIRAPLLRWQQDYYAPHSRYVSVRIIDSATMPQPDGRVLADVRAEVSGSFWIMRGMIPGSRFVCKDRADVPGSPRGESRCQFDQTPYAWRRRVMCSRWSSGWQCEGQF